MNSLELYDSILAALIQPNYDNNIRYCSIIVDSIIEEVMAEPKSVFNSPFVCEAIKLVKKEQTALLHLDAYVVLYAVHKKLVDNCYYIFGDVSIQDKGYYLFKHTEIHSDEEKYILKIKTLIHLVQKDINENEYDFSNNSLPVLNKDVANSRCINDDQIPLQNFTSSLVTEKIEVLNDKVFQHLEEIQLLQSNALNELMNFKKELNDLYVLIVGKKLITLYCCVYDNYKYHEAQSEKNNEKNYKKLINNNVSYLEELEDCLESLGIEIIISESGSPFQGKYQETKQTDFDPRNAVILKSMLPGFKYGDDVIVKEQVKVQGDN